MQIEGNAIQTIVIVLTFRLIPANLCTLDK